MYIHYLTVYLITCVHATSLPSFTLLLFFLAGKCLFTQELRITATSSVQQERTDKWLFGMSRYMSIKNLKILEMLAFSKQYYVIFNVYSVILNKLQTLLRIERVVKCHFFHMGNLNCQSQFVNELKRKIIYSIFFFFFSVLGELHFWLENFLNSETTVFQGFLVLFILHYSLWTM